MRQRPIATARLASSQSSRRLQRGASILELVIVMAVASIMAAIAVPLVSNLQRTMRLNAAVSAVAGTMQSPVIVPSTTAAHTPWPFPRRQTPTNFPVKSPVVPAQPPDQRRTAVPFADPGGFSLDQDVTFQFSPAAALLSRPAPTVST